MAIEREVAGLRCGDVLAELSDFLDGELTAPRQAQVEAHLRGCDVCERFGGVFSAAIRALQQGGFQPVEEAPAVFQRLNIRLGMLAKR